MSPESEGMEALRNLQAAFVRRRILSYREGDTLIVNDPYLARQVEITAYGLWFHWSGPDERPCQGDVDSPGHTAHRIITQFAGIHRKADV